MRACLPSLLLSALLVGCASRTPLPQPKMAAPPVAPDPPVMVAPSPAAAQVAPVTPSPTQKDEEVTAALGTAPLVKVIDTGAAPKKALRYKLKAGVTEYLEMDMKMSLGMTMGDTAAPKTELPTIRSTVRINGVKLTTEGDLRCTFDTEKIELLNDAKMEAKMREPLEKELKGLVGMHGKALISTRGVATETVFELPSHASPGLNAEMEVIRDAIHQMYLPLPEEQIGKGATWDVISRLPINGALVDSKVSYTLTKVDTNADTAQADLEIALVAPSNQTMRLSVLPGATATLDSLVGKGAGKVSASLSRLVSTTSSKIATAWSLSVITKTGQQIEMKLQSDAAIKARPGAAPALPRRP